ncbi:hypothetical protein STRDD11_02231 [Streptococcus sp. DD11]|nr:hypothetical protein STRDD11_02231 [Streptococcus sp. DD11]
MISETYFELLCKEVRNLDEFSSSKYQLEKIVNDIANYSSNAELELIQKLGILKKERIIPKFDVKQGNIIELLYKYLGAREIDEKYSVLKSEAALSFEDLSNQLNELIGLDFVKEQISNLICFNKVQFLRERQNLKKAYRTMHMAFLGNPGTAKTTVARIVGKMYKSLGLLSKGHFIETSRTDLIAEYQGQTAIKVKRLVQKAKGGVLFIDEAYSITENENSDSYGRECLTELTKALEDYREDLVVIVAGYQDLMEKFFQSNPGLKSRFNNFIIFNDYSLDEMFSIFTFFVTRTII